MRTVKNFARFYALLNKMPEVNKDEIKEMLVDSFTKGRTTSLRSMTPQEYNAMCDSIDSQKEKVSNSTAARLKSARSAVLRRLQKLGVNTTDWSEVDKFCLNARIAGKKFYNLSTEELRALVPKLESIANKPTKHAPQSNWSKYLKENVLSNPYVLN